MTNFILLYIFNISLTRNKEMFKLSFILSLTIIFLPSLSMYLSFNQKPTCFVIEESPEKEVIFFFEVMGA